MELNSALATLAGRMAAWIETRKGGRALSEAERSAYRDLDRAVGWTAFVALIAIVVVAPETGYAQTATTTLSPLEEIVESIIGIMTGPIATGIGIIAVAAVGYFWLSGRLELQRALYVVLGLALVFGAPQIVRALRESTTATGPGSISG